jgi:hypothetical protein
MTRPVTVGQAGPRLTPGGRFGATLAAADRRLAQAVVTLESPAPSPGFVNGHAMLHNRWWPAIESDGTGSLDELVTMSGYDGEVTEVWAGSADLELFSSPVDELSLLVPEEVIGSYYHRVGVSWKGGTTLRRNLPLEVETA